MLLAGTSVVAAGIASFGMLAVGSSLLRTLASAILQLGLVFVAGGGTALYLSRPRGFVLPNERAAGADSRRPEIGGWLTLLAVALVAVPAGMILRLTPFLAEWRAAIDFLSASGSFDGSTSSMSGIVLLPVAAALSPPLVELATMFGFVAGSAILLLLLLRRSPHFPRAYLVCVVLMGALVIASVIGASAATTAAAGIERLMEDSRPRADEAAELRHVLGRYTGIVGSTAPVLVWTLCAYLFWLPAVYSSPRARTTFAARPAAPANDIEAITSPPRFPG